MIWHEIRTMDGRTLSRTHSISERWQWILDVISGDAGCDHDDINIIETEAGDIITVKDKPYARVLTSLHDA